MAAKRPFSAGGLREGSQTLASPIARAKLQRPISAMGRPIASDLQDGVSHKPRQIQVVRPSSALGLTKAGLPDFRAPPTQCPTHFDRSGYAEWEAGAKGKQAEDMFEVMNKLADAPLNERKRPGNMAKHVHGLRSKLTSINEALDTLPEDDATRTLIEGRREALFHAMEECLPLAYVPPDPVEEEEEDEAAEWEAQVLQTVKQKEPTQKKKYRVDEFEGQVDPVTGRADVAMIMDLKRAEALAHEVMARRDVERKERQGGSFDPLTPEERALENKQELESLMDRLAMGKGGVKKAKKPKPVKANPDSPGESSESDEDERPEDETLAYALRMFARRGPRKGVPTEFERMQIALRACRKEEKAKKSYYQEEQAYLRAKGLIPEEDDNMHGLGIYDTTNPKKPRRNPWYVGVDRRRAIELALREKSKHLQRKPLRAEHVFMRQRTDIDGPKKGQGHDWVRVECRLFEEGTLELVRGLPKKRILISLQQCSAASQRAADHSEVDSRVQAITFDFRYEEVRYDKPQQQAALLRPSSAHTMRGSPEAEFVIAPHTQDAVIYVLDDGGSRDGGMEEILLRAETVSGKHQWLEAMNPFVATASDILKMAKGDPEDDVGGREAVSSAGHVSGNAVVSTRSKDGLVGSLERGMGKLRFYGRQFAVASTYSLRRLKRRSTEVVDNLARSLSPIRDMNPSRFIENVFHSGDKFKRGMRRSRLGSTEEEGEEDSVSNLLLVKTGNGAVTAVSRKSESRAANATPFTKRDISYSPVKVVSTSSRPGDTAMGTPASSAKSKARGVSPVRPGSALQKRGNVFVDSPIRPSSAFPTRRNRRVPLSASAHSPEDLFSISSPRSELPSSSTTKTILQNSKGMLQAMSPQRLLRPGTATRATKRLGRLLPAEEDYYHTHPQFVSSPLSRTLAQSPTRRGQI